MGPLPKGLLTGMILQVFPGFQGETDPAKLDFSSGAVVPETGESMLRLDLDIPCPSINNLATYYAVLHLKARWWSRFTFERVTFSSSQKSDKESPGRCLFILHVISRITRRMHSTAPTPWNTAKINLELLACMDGKPREVLKGTIAEVEGLTHLKNGTCEVCWNDANFPNWKLYWDSTGWVFTRHQIKTQRKYPSNLRFCDFPTIFSRKKTVAKKHTELTHTLKFSNWPGKKGTKEPQAEPQGTPNGFFWLTRRLCKRRGPESPLAALDLQSCHLKLRRHWGIPRTWPRTQRRPTSGGGPGVWAQMAKNWEKKPSDHAIFRGRNHEQFLKVSNLWNNFLQAKRFVIGGDENKAVP